MGHPSEGIGSWSTEAARLFVALTDAADVAGGADAAGETVDPVGDSDQAEARDRVEGGSDCGSCPLCRARRTLNRPEVREPLMSAASSLLQAVSALLSTPVPDSADRPEATEKNEDL